MARGNCVVGSSPACPTKAIIHAVHCPKERAAVRADIGSEKTPHGWEMTPIKVPQNGNSAIRGYSSAGRAPALQAGGQRFDPAYLHHSSLHIHLMTARKDGKSCASAPKRRTGRQHAVVAQSVERLICNQQVGGSSPSTSSTGRPFHSPALFSLLSFSWQPGKTGTAHSTNGTLGAKKAGGGAFLATRSPRCCSTMARAPAFQAGDAGSIPVSGSMALHESPL